MNANRVVEIVDEAVRIVALIGSAALIGLVMLIVVDVTLRYFFNAPIYGGHDIAELLLLVTVATSMGYSGRTGGQVAVDFLNYVIPARFLRWIDAAIRFLGAGILLLLAWQCAVNGLNAAEFGGASNLLRIPFLPFYLLLGVGMFLYALVLILELFVPAAASMSQDQE